MRKVLFVVLALLIGTIANLAQTPDGAVKASLVPGDVVSLSGTSIVIKTKDGSLNVELSPKTEYKRVAAEKPSIASATPAALTDIVAGDKVIVSGVFGDDKTKLPARTVYLMSKSDIAQKNAKDAEKWTTRGISGRVSSVNLAAKQIGIEVRGLMGTTTTMITAKDSAVIKRYAPNSVKYTEAVGSSLIDIQPGDMLRASGDKSGDGLSFAADEIITGAFQTVAGTVKSIDAAKNEIVITNLQTNKDMTVSLVTASTMKKFPEEFAQRMVQMQGGGAQGSGGPRPGVQPGSQPGAQPGAARQPVTGSQPGGPGRGMMMGGRGGGIDEMLERFPTIAATDLKVGDMVAVSSTKNGAMDKISAIKLLAGVEPFIRAAQASGDLQRGGRGGQNSFNIPGLDGFDSP
jgi:hypothetical protein